VVLAVVLSAVGPDSDGGCEEQAPAKSTHATAARHDRRLVMRARTTPKGGR